MVKLELRNNGTVDLMTKKFMTPLFGGTYISRKLLPTYHLLGLQILLLSQTLEKHVEILLDFQILQKRWSWIA